MLCHKAVTSVFRTVHHEFHISRQNWWMGGWMGEWVNEWICLPDSPFIIQTLTVKKQQKIVSVVRSQAPLCGICLIRELLLPTLHFLISLRLSVTFRFPDPCCLRSMHFSNRSVSHFKVCILGWFWEFLISCCASVTPQKNMFKCTKWCWWPVPTVQDQANIGNYSFATSWRSPGLC